MTQQKNPLSGCFVRIRSITLVDRAVRVRRIAISSSATGEQRLTAGERKRTALILPLKGLKLSETDVSLTKVRASIVGIAPMPPSCALWLAVCVALACAPVDITASLARHSARKGRAHTMAPRSQPCNETTVPPSASALGLASRLAAAVSAGASTFQVASARYVFGNTSLRFVGAKNLVVDVAPDTEFIFSLGSGVQFVDCDNVTVNGNGLALDAATANYAQGTVAPPVGTQSSFFAAFDPSFLTPDSGCDPFVNPGAPAGAHVVLWDPKTRTMIPTWTSTPMASSSVVGNTIWKINLVHPNSNPPMAGTLVTIFPRRGFTWSMINCSRMSTYNVMLFAGGNEGFTECCGEGGNVYQGVRVTRRPGSNGLLSINADGFNVDSVGQGPTIIDSEVGFNGDDAISVHNRIQVVCNVTGTNRLVIMDLGQGKYEWDKYGSALHGLGSGDLLKFFTFDTLSAMGESVVANSHNVSGSEDAMTVCRAAYTVMQSKTTKPVVEPFVSPSLFAVQFSASLPHGVLDSGDLVVVSFGRRSSTGAVVRGNHFHDGAQRSAILGASDLVLDGNVFERALSGGLHVESEEWALEGSIAISNVTITNNVVVGAKKIQIGIDIINGTTNVTCHNNTWAVGDQRTTLQHC